MANNIKSYHDTGNALSSDSQTASINDNYILKLFNIDHKPVDCIKINHMIDGIHVDIQLSCEVHRCPVCGTETSLINNYVHKKISHSILNGVPCYIDYHARRHKCPACKKTFYEHNPFTLQGMKISLATVYNVLKDLKNCNETFTSVANRYNISPTAVSSIFDNHVNVPRRTLPEYICIDEVYGFKSEKSNYVCVLVDFSNNKVIDLLPSRRKYDLINYFTLIPREERERVKIVSSDMWETYRIVSKLVFPNAVNACDKFHVIQEFTKKMDRVRIDAMNHIKVPPNLNKDSLTREQLANINERNKSYYVLKKFNWLLFKNDDQYFDPNQEKKYNRVLEGYYNYYDLVEYMIRCENKLEEAYDLKTELMIFYRDSTYKDAKENIEHLIQDFKSSSIPYMNDFSNTLIRWKKEIINSFIVTKGKRRINNGIIENRNKTIKNIKHNSNGYTNWQRYRNRCLYILNSDVTFYMYPNKND